MTMKPSHAGVLIALAVVVMGAALSVFTVRETEHAIVLQFGEPKRVISEAGLHFKLPLIQNVRYFDNRILSVDPQTQRMNLSSDKSSPLRVKDEDLEISDEQKEALEKLTTEVSGEPINVEAFARYRIVDPLLFLQRMVTEDVAEQRIRAVMEGATRDVLGQTTLRTLLSSRRSTVMNEIRDRVNTAMADRGVEIVDFRIAKADLTDTLRTSTVSRMITERKEKATETRATGQELAQQIRSKADKERAIILAEAEKDAQIVRGQGDETAIKTYAAAFNKDKDFYAFTRSLEAYRNTLGDPATQLILSPDGAFFRYFNNAP
ncbi:protease modulator HflC [Micavibrio aeruginosavorus]|uniref:Protein HflC n=1 Tax=Micavibrio aeruginosavorus (strain ARL-13) TaxID=856793 RepID=G2KS63_MICAA|nr:protease modulator HflC [Micavibrio aeruginosavorus]AEP08746.1 hflC protein [Micavibrio aeruginosavorus ARL-13]